jgi:CheY-like chemotaxis protein
LAALDLQRALEHEVWPEEIVVGVRIALHTGEAEERTGDYFGSTVNRASRLRGLADAGQILLSGSTADVVADHLEHATLIELGERTLRGLARKERVFELCDASPSPEGTASSRLRVMLVDDHPIWRQAVKVLVERDSAAVVVAEADDGEEATAIANDVKPDLVLMDLHLPGIGGIEATRRITESLPDVRVLILSASEEDADVITALRAGALGYVLKSGTGQEVVDAVRRVIAGEAVFSAALSPTVLAELRRK